MIGDHGYVIQVTEEFEKKANKKVLEHLYYEGISDRITNEEKCYLIPSPN